MSRINVRRYIVQLVFPSEDQPVDQGSRENQSFYGIQAALKIHSECVISACLESESLHLEANVRSYRILRSIVVTQLCTTKKEKEEKCEETNNENFSRTFHNTQDSL